MSELQISYRDKSAEISNVALAFDDVSSGGADFDTRVAEMTAVLAAINTISLCVDSKVALRQDINPWDADIPTDDAAQREYALRVFYTDDVNGKSFHFTIPGPDMSVIDIVTGTDFADLSGAALQALETAVNAGVLSPYGNSVTLRKAVVVGRRA
jgi:hypothetical protein